MAPRPVPGGYPGPMGGSAEPDAAPEDGAAEQPPLTALLSRFRVPIGLLVAAVGIALAVVTLVANPGGLSTGSTRAILARAAGIGIWALVAAVGATWAFALPRRVWQGCAYAALGCWLLALLTNP